MTRRCATGRWLRFRIALTSCLLALLTASSFGQQIDTVTAIAAENASFTAQLRGDQAGVDRWLAELENLRKAKHDLEERLQWIEQRAAVYPLGPELVRALNEQLRELPRQERFAVANAQRHDLLVDASDADLRVERGLRELTDLDAATQRRLSGAIPAPTQERQQTVRAGLTEQRDLLLRLAVLEHKRLDVLHELDEAWRDLDSASQAARAKLTRFLFWIPAPPSTRTADQFGPALGWVASLTNWRAAGEVMREEVLHRSVWPLLVLVAAALLLLLRDRLLHRLGAIAPSTVTYERYRIGHTIAALGITLTLAAPVPLILWTFGATLSHAPDAESFVLAVGDALLAISKLLLAISVLAWLLDGRGVAVRHFGWNKETSDITASTLRKFAAVFIPLCFVAALNGLDHAPFANRESLARLAFSLAMITLALLLVRLLRPRSPIMLRLRERTPRSRAVQLHAFWFAPLLITPIAIAALAAGGYFVAAGYFFGRIVESVFLGICAVMLYGLMALWVQVQRLQLSHRREEEATDRSYQPGAAVEAGAEVADASPAQLDITMIGEQTRSLLDMLVTVLLLIGIWWVWRDALPVLSVIFDYSLWNYTELIDGKQVTRPLTVGYLFLAIVIGVVTAVMVRNIGALLDIVLLQRLEMQTDANYAIKVITRYAVTLIGVLLACSILGIRWGDVQWLVAALGVGLGFGLQEIVANFVSGLIVLAERPIRIGDVVTVGNVSGTVLRIHARATVVMDFDYKEVIIPNKAFITERVVNWTLSTQTTRLLINVGIAYGSDVDLAQRVMLAAVRDNRDVLQEPAASVFFVAFGESTLNFEIRAFVSSTDKRLRVQHEINNGVARALRANRIDIPFPQRDLHIRTMPGLARASGGGSSA